MNRKSQKIRVFFGIALPDGIRGWINGAAMVPLSRLPARVRWVQPSNIHLTVRFLGEIDYDTLSDVIENTGRATSNIPSMKFQLKEIATFGRKTPRVIWVGVSGDIEELTKLHDKIEIVCREAGLPADDKRYFPHITIGRVKSPAHTGQLMSAIKKIDVKPLDFTAKELILFKSVLTPKGSIYDVVEKFILK